MAHQESKCEEVREWLVGQGYSVSRIGHIRCGHSPQSPTVEGGVFDSHGLRWSQCLDFTHLLGFVLNVCRDAGHGTHRYLQCAHCCMIGLPLFGNVLLDRIVC